MASLRLTSIIILTASVVSVDIAASSFSLMSAFKITHGDFKSDFTQYKFSNSLTDIWFQSIIRICILLGAVIGLARNVQDGKERTKKADKVVKYVAIVMELFIVVKVLYWAEDSKEYLKFPVWLFFCISFLMNIILYCVWQAFGYVNVRIRKYVRLTINDEMLEATTPEFLNEGHNDSESDTSSTNSDNEDGDNDDEGVKYGSWKVVSKLLSLSKPDIVYLVPGFIFLIAAAVGEVFLPLFTGRVIDGITIRRDYSEFMESITIMAFISLAMGIFSGLRGGLLSYVTARFTIRLQNNLYATVLDQEIGFYDTRKTGEIISRLTSDTTKVGDQLSVNVNIFLRNIIKLIGVLVFMFKLSWKLTVLTLVGLPLIFEIYGAFGKYYEQLSEKVQSSLASANESAAEAIASIRTVKSFGAEDIEKARYFNKLSFTFSLKKKEALSYGGFICVNEMLDLALALLVLFYGGHLVLRGDLSGGHLVSFILYDLELGDSLESIGEIYTGLMEAVGAARKVFHYLERTPKIDRTGCLVFEEFKGRIEFSNVTFAYPTRPDLTAVTDLSFTADPGEVVAIVGPSGGGKSTIVSLLEHFYEPQAGKILLDGIPINSYEHRFLHTKMALVAQEPVLFARPIMENIAYALREDVSEDKVIDAAVHANISQFISELPDGYQTEAGEKGVQLSGGQKQRVAIARALIRNPSVLILDEATSALDSESEFLVQDAINRNLNGRTVVIIAHRLSTIEKADKILVIEKGKLVEQGTHASLFANDGVYASLVRRQLLTTAETSGDI